MSDAAKSHVMGTPELAVFGAAAENDDLVASAPAAVEAAVAASNNPQSMLQPALIVVQGTVKLTRRGRDDPSMARCPSSFGRHTLPHPTDGTNAFSAHVVPSSEQVAADTKEILHESVYRDEPLRVRLSSAPRTPNRGKSSLRTASAQLQIIQGSISLGTGFDSLKVVNFDATRVGTLSASVKWTHAPTTISIPSL